ncbi:hypothetical protein A374_05151 [Fictibacillus macauensis ZFHKF-1]|uniref:Uncharacterized protein n=1 Tax=Fictibacillus macauensis ZFHKF-1 TaxID=1196324 RepID=I8AL43_9BACL|nr:hypothetical protein [Fictibacillus macauensis]EIT86324.1 hypothetical protein A374_05151 [Fictibacillus macauensis ZFHKF-1]
MKNKSKCWIGFEYGIGVAAFLLAIWNGLYVNSAATLFLLVATVFLFRTIERKIYGTTAECWFSGSVTVLFIWLAFQEW